MNFKQELAAILHELLDQEITQTNLELMIEKPKNQELGDLAFPCFTLAKLKRKSPNLIAGELSKKINSPIFEKVEVVGAYINFFLNKKTASEKVVNEI
ncbi:MAG: arginine--tRNA ligase, partial [Bacillus sp. (in: firmicutes)]